MKIAIIGTGISGLTAAYLLHERHDVHVYEGSHKIGGHTATIDVEHDGENYAIDSGFIVFNDKTYPMFNKLLKDIGVDRKKTEMSFSLSCSKTGLEYAGSNINTLFAQRKNMLNLYFWKLLRDIYRFNNEVIAELDAGVICPETTLGSYLVDRGYGQGFIQHYLVPMGAAIWSASTQVMLKFPLMFFIRFFNNHGLLDIRNRPQWYVIPGGSKNYLQPLTHYFSHRITCNANIKNIRRTNDQVIIEFNNNLKEYFDQVVIATHSDQALALLQDATAEEEKILGAISYKPNEVVMHYDESLLPENRRTWSSWNYLLTDYPQDEAVLTYNMNILQGIKAPVTFCVTLNNAHAINKDKIINRFVYDHPVFTVEGVAAQEKWQQVNGVNRTWFCGAYWANGFHEDGVQSAVRVSEKLGGATL